MHWIFTPEYYISTQFNKVHFILHVQPKNKQATSYVSKMFSFILIYPVLFNIIKSVIV